MQKTKNLWLKQLYLLVLKFKLTANYLFVLYANKYLFSVPRNLDTLNINTKAIGAAPSKGKG